MGHLSYETGKQCGLDWAWTVTIEKMCIYALQIMWSCRYRCYVGVGCEIGDVQFSGGRDRINPPESG